MTTSTEKSLSEIRQRVKEAGAQVAEALPKTEGKLIDALYDDIAGLRREGQSWVEVAQVLEAAGVVSPNPRSKGSGKPLDNRRIRILFERATERRQKRAGKYPAPAGRPSTAPASAFGAAVESESDVSVAEAAPAMSLTLKNEGAPVSSLRESISRSKPAALPSQAGKKIEPAAARPGLEKFVGK